MSRIQTISALAAAILFTAITSTFIERAGMHCAAVTLRVVGVVVVAALTCRLLDTAERRRIAQAPVAVLKARTVRAVRNSPGDWRLDENGWVVEI